jgi:uncharacterized protein YjiS (DUF1127 family)
MNDKETVMPTLDLLLPPQSHSAWRPVRKPLHPVAAASRMIARWIERSRQRDVLARLDDRALRDVGITRAEVARECEKPFWR